MNKDLSFSTISAMISSVELRGFKPWSITLNPYDIDKLTLGYAGKLFGLHLISSVIVPKGNPIIGVDISKYF